MRSALGVAVAVAVLLCHPSFLSPKVVRASVAGRQALMLKLTPLTERTVRRALDFALSKLGRPGCSQIYEDFELPNGGTPRRELDRLGIGPEDLLESLVFMDGGRDPVCRNGRAVLTTTPGSRVIRVCPGFARLQFQHPDRSACLIIHESLHALGLGENPPSSSDITNRVERRCW
jgi:hypothetical protein